MRPISKDLLRLGMTQCKSKTLLFPHGKIEKKFYKDFILGCIDGDGWICKTGKYYHVGFCGTKHMCMGIKKFIKEAIGVELTLLKNNTIYSIRTQDKTKFYKICSFLYSNNVFCMNRKIKIFNQFKKENAKLFV